MNGAINTLRVNTKLDFQYGFLFYLFVGFCLSVLIFSEGLSYMLLDWQREEFSHGYMIPIVSLYLLLQKLPKIADVELKRPGWGFPILMIGLMCYFLGELSAIYIVIQYGFIIALVGITISWIGTQGIKVIAVPLAYLLFMVPLPNFLYFNLSSHLQLISSAFGVFMLRLFDVSVYLEGNVIDLGHFKLQVVDACSGLRYLFPLMSFGFLVAYIYRASFWKKTLIFLSTIPITILMNSFRIMVIGITVDAWGIKAAEGFVHDFQGWVVFMSSLGLLAMEMMLIHRLSGNRNSLVDDLALSLPSPIFDRHPFKIQKKITTPMMLTLLLLIMVLPIKAVMVDRIEKIPSRLQFSTMPLSMQKWAGHASFLDQDVVEALKFEDYLVADYVNADSGQDVNLYTAYYQSQRKGASVHSPKTCLPGGGWQIQKFSQIEFNNTLFPQAQNMQVNRVLIQKGETRNLVYYWFQQRGRIITNEYLAKWFIFWDALTRNRTDGALVRVTAAVANEADIDKADLALQNFIGNLSPLLPRYIPE
jgi:hypothetical protein